MNPQQFQNSYAGKHEVTVCSIVPFPLPACIRPLYTPVSRYELGVEDGVFHPPSPEKPFHLIVRDAWQPEYQGENQGNRNLLVLAEHIALDVVKDFTERIQGWAQGQHLGVCVCDGPVATKQEIDRLVVAQDKFYRHQIDIADEVWLKEGTGKNIRSLARQSATAMKIERDWLHVITSTDKKDCPRCGERIKAMAEGCRFCGVDIVAYLEKKRADLAALVTAPKVSKEPRLVQA